jgi:hypothetical protein
MKKIVHLLLIGVALTTQTLFAQVPSYVPTNGIVGYWPFNGNANDESGNGNNGTVNGATLSADRFGNTNKSYSFGPNKYVEVLNSSSINLTNSISISIWVKAQPSTTIIRKGFQYGIDLDIFNSSGNTNGLYPHSYQPTLLSPNPVIQDNWTHIVTTNGNNVQKMYINGVLVKTTNITSTYTLYPNNLTIGSWYLNETYNGMLDDIGLWNRVLTQQEITNLYNANQCLTNITVTDTLIINVGQLSFNDPITWANNITIAPNPASSEINISFNNITNLNGGTLKIINSLGQEVATTPITASGTNSTMQLATWGGTGMYFVQIINPQGQIVDIKKIILQ